MLSEPITVLENCVRTHFKFKAALRNVAYPNYNQYTPTKLMCVDVKALLTSKVYVVYAYHPVLIVVAISHIN